MRGFYPLCDIEGRKDKIIGFLEDFFGNIFFQALPEHYELISDALDKLRDSTEGNREARTFSALLRYLPDGELKDKVSLLTEGNYSFCDGKMDDLKRWTIDGFDSVALSLVDYYSENLS